MFESTKPVSQTQTARFAQRFDGRGSAESDMLVGTVDSASVAILQDAGREIDGHESDGFGGDALRLIEWGELTARLNAARDLRLVLRRDANRNIEAGGGSFADAAARYFRTKDNLDDRGKRDVNPVALEHCKGSPGMTDKHNELREEVAQIQRHAVNGDARDN